MSGNPSLELTVPADSEISTALQEAFFADIASRYPGWKLASSQSVKPSELAPTGTWIVAYLDGRPVGCGGLQALDTESAEIRRIFLDPSARGRGIGRAILAELACHMRRDRRLLDGEPFRGPTGSQSSARFVRSGQAEARVPRGSSRSAGTGARGAQPAAASSWAASASRRSSRPGGPTS
jgi:GNAT superfamily N-acetyltransferase